MHCDQFQSHYYVLTILHYYKYGTLPLYEHGQDFFSQIMIVFPPIINE